jgi:hypothetical protein
LAVNKSTHEEPRNPHVRFEPGDVDASGVTKFGIGMAFLIVVFLFGIWGLFSYFKSIETADQPKPRPGADLAVHAHPPDPQLQPHPVQDYEKFRKIEDTQINEYAWLDPDKGVVRIPVDAAMQAMLKKGFPTIPQNGGKEQ